MSEWLERSRKYTVTSKATGFSIAFAGMKFEDSDLAGMADKFARAAREMKKIEAGEIKNPDEQRKVTHFTDRINYPKSQLFADVEEFASAVRDGKSSFAQHQGDRPFGRALLRLPSALGVRS